MNEGQEGRKELGRGMPIEASDLRLDGEGGGGDGGGGEVAEGGGIGQIDGRGSSRGGERGGEKGCATCC